MTSDEDQLLPWQWLERSDDLNRDTLVLFDAVKLEQLIDYMGPQAKLWALKRGLQITVRHHLAARLLSPRRPPGKTEWKRMVRFGDAAKAYAKALESLLAIGSADQRLIFDLANVPKGRELAGDVRFKRLFEQSGPRSPLRQLLELVEATAASADRLAIDSISNKAGDPATEYLNAVAWLGSPGDTRNMEAICLTETLKSFRRVWSMNSDKPFNAGKYYSDIGGFVGNAIDASHLVMTTLDPQVTQRKVATAIREINRS